MKQDFLSIRSDSPQRSDQNKRTKKRIKKKNKTGAHLRSHGLSLVFSDYDQRRGSAFRTALAIAERNARKRNLEETARRIDTEVLAIEGVADYLHCSVQVVRNIPVSELPRSNGPGKRLLYLRDDVIDYVRRHQTQALPVDKNSRSLDEQIDSEADNVRRRST